ncbi:MAG: P-II family nitrogen regulator [Gammaproteobacteria bacterium]|nr:P-II family nitrogen regulator [Gammaproteobacteria bacterium]MDH5801458.1 P-II family nitrogen regulator [Gammaproteobacteria bacterium]
MKTKCVVAIIRESQLNQVIEALRDASIPGVTVTRIRGYGEYVNTFTRDTLEENVKLEIFVSEHEVNDVINPILNHAGTESQGDGIVAVLDVDELFRVRDRSSLS